MSPSPATHQVRFCITRVEAWGPGVATAGEWLEWSNGKRELGSTGEPALQQMPPMLRRHAGRLGRLASSPAYDALGELRDVPMVFSSRYGEVSRSVELLTALCAGDELSPTSFGLSVHNAVPGLLSMARKETANSSSVAAGNDCAEAGVIEACGLIQDGAEQVLLVVADCPLPQIYGHFAETTPEAFGWACLMNAGSGPQVTLEWRDGNQYSAEDRPGHSGALEVLPLLLGHRTELVRSTSARLWHWTRNG